MTDITRDRPLEEAQKSYRIALEQQTMSGAEELERSARGLLMSSLTGGMEVGFGPLLMAGILTAGAGQLPEYATKFLLANAYAVGFILVILGRSALFTEQTATAVLPILAGAYPIRRLLRLWGLVLIGNVVGAIVFAGLATWLGTSLGAADAESFAHIADGLVRHDTGTMLLSAVIAGWLVALIGWMIATSRGTIAQLVIIWMITATIGFLGLHHSIAGTVEAFQGVFVGGVRIGDAVRFMGTSVLGNAIGGVIFVALLRDGHIRIRSD